jgi:hypothetical protein
VYGYGVVTDLLRRYASSDLIGLVAFVPMWAGDSNEAATHRAVETSDLRIIYWWDGARESDRPFAATLGLHGPAWDIYLLYGPGTIWESSTPPAPHFWMHQLPTEQDTYPDGYLDPLTLESQLQQLVWALKEGADTNADDFDHHVSRVRDTEN